MNEALLKALKAGFAITIYEDDAGVHVGLIESKAVTAARNNLDGDGEHIYALGFIDTEGGSAAKLKGFNAFEAPLINMAQMLTDD